MFSGNPSHPSTTHNHEDEDAEQAMLQDQQLQTFADLSEQIKEQERRAEEMDRLHVDIEDVHTIFQDLSQMVHVSFFSMLTV